MFLHLEAWVSGNSSPSLDSVQAAWELVRHGVYEIQLHPGSRQCDLTSAEEEPAPGTLKCGLQREDQRLLRALQLMLYPVRPNQNKNWMLLGIRATSQKELFSKQSNAESQCDIRTQAVWQETPTRAKTVSNGETTVTSYQLYLLISRL